MSPATRGSASRRTWPRAAGARSRSAVDRFVNALDTTPQSEYVALVSYGSNYTACSVSNNSSDIN